MGRGGRGRDNTEKRWGGIKRKVKNEGEGIAEQNRRGVRWEQKQGGVEVGGGKELGRKGNVAWGRVWKGKKEGERGAARSVGNRKEANGEGEERWGEGGHGGGEGRGGSGSAGKRTDAGGR